MSIQKDIKKMLAESGWTQKQLAEAAGVNQCALSKMLNRDGGSILERIHPFIYGEKRPEKTEPSHALQA